jgi:outer membrane lipoprotein-sorting protein
MEARYEEERRLALLSAPLKSEGRIYFAPPAHLLRRTEKPLVSVVLLDGDRLWFGDAKGKTGLELGASPVVRAFVESFTQVLAGNLEALRQRYELRFEPAPDGPSWTLVLTPREASLAQRMARIEVRGVDVQISEVRVVESRGDETVTRFLEMNVDRHFGSDELARLFDAPAQ